MVPIGLHPIAQQCVNDEPVFRMGMALGSPDSLVGLC
jgi:hypothetical protein